MNEDPEQPSDEHDDSVLEPEDRRENRNILGCALAIIVLAIGSIVTAYLLFASAMGGLPGGSRGRQILIGKKPINPSRKKPSPNTSREEQAAFAWAKNGDTEWISVAAFQRLGWELMQVGASPQLVSTCIVAAEEELDHTNRCFAVANGLSPNIVYHPTALPELALAVRKEVTIALLAEEALRDAIYLEFVSAEIARELIDVCEHENIRQLLRIISKDERSHSEQGWKVLDFCLQKDPNSMHAVTRMIEKLKREQALAVVRDEENLEAFGIATQARMNAISKRVLEEVETTFRRNLQVQRVA